MGNPRDSWFRSPSTNQSIIWLKGSRKLHKLTIPNLVITKKCQKFAKIILQSELCQIEKFNKDDSTNHAAGKFSKISGSLKDLGPKKTRHHGEEKKFTMPVLDLGLLLRHFRFPEAERKRKRHFKVTKGPKHSRPRQSTQWNSPLARLDVDWNPGQVCYAKFSWSAMDFLSGSKIKLFFLVGVRKSVAANSKTIREREVKNVHILQNVSGCFYQCVLNLKQNSF